MERALFFPDPVFGTIIQVYTFLLGAIVGSFLNVCIYRIPLQQSIVTPRSSCPNCHTPIRWYQNIPILSYIFLRGRCANCKVKISPIYPFVEAVTGLLFLFLYRKFGISIPFVTYAVFGCSMIALLFIDYYHRILPHKITIPGILFGFITSFGNPYVGPVDSILGILVGGILPLVVYLLYIAVRKKEGMGQGDIVMLADVGAYLGWRQVILVLFAASILGTLVALISMMVFRKDSEFQYPLGTFIGIVAIPAIFFGFEVWQMLFPF